MPKIAIIDDDSDIVEALTMLLSAKGYSVVSAANIPEAIKVVDGEKPDLILLDLMLPKINGFEVLNQLKQNEKTKNIPIIIVSAKILSKEEELIKVEIERLFNKGMFTRDELVNEIIRVLDRNNDSLPKKELESNCL